MLYLSLCSVTKNSQEIAGGTKGAVCYGALAGRWADIYIYIYDRSLDSLHSGIMLFNKLIT